jgi:hypothetical protein
VLWCFDLAPLACREVFWCCSGVCSGFYGVDCCSKELPASNGVLSGCSGLML